MPRAADLCVVFVQQEDLFVRERLSYGQSIRQLTASVYTVIGTVAGDLGGAVQIDKLCIRQLLHPHSQVLLRHDLAAEQNALYRVRRFVVKPVKCADQTKRRDRPYHGRNTVLADKIDQLGRFYKQSLWNDHKRGAGLDRRVDILYRDIKIKWSLIPYDICTVYFKQLRKIIDKVNDGAVTYQHALRRPRGAGGEVGIERIGIHLRACGVFQQLLVGTRGDKLTEAANAVRELPGSSEMLIICNDELRRQDINYLLQS